MPELMPPPKCQTLNHKHYPAYKFACYVRVVARYLGRTIFFAALVLVFNLALNHNFATANPRLELPFDSGMDKGKIVHMDTISRPSGLRFPVVFYLAMDHPGIINIIQQTDDRKLAPDPNIELPMYLGYLVVSEDNRYVFVSRVDSLPAVKSYVANIILEEQKNKKQGLLCSGEGSYLCATENSWSAVWVLLNAFYNKGVYVAGYTTGKEPNNSFVPSFKDARKEKQYMASVLYPKSWPEFNNNLLGMKPFNRQAYGLPIYAYWWYGMNGSESLSQGAIPQNMNFPLVYYFNLTAQGVDKFLASNKKAKEEGGLNSSFAPVYAGYLVVDKDYTYLFTRKTSFSTSLPALVNTENSLKPGEKTEVDGFFNMKISAPAHSWNGLGVFLAKIVSSGDYEIFAYTSGKPAVVNYNPPALGPAPVNSSHFKGNINSSLFLYEAQAGRPNYEEAGLSKFNSILFYEFEWPEQWAKGATGPRLDSAWE